MKHDKAYMHPRAMDVYLFVRKSLYVSEEDVFLIRGDWYNLGYVGEPWWLDNFADKIKGPDSQNWVDITDKINVVRKEPGLP